MYVPAAFAVADPAEAEAMLARQNFGCLVCAGPDGLVATHMPFLHDPLLGRLTGHMARPNPHRQGSATDGEALVIFQGPHAYVSPSWYPSKAATGRAVPTWNYEAVHVYGRLAWRDDPDWLIAHVTALSARHEAHRPEPWAVSDAPADYIAGLARGIVGVELAITRIEAKRKLSQNRPEADRRGVIAALEAGADPQDAAAAAAMRSALA
jgi:transcriptional regulator